MPFDESEIEKLNGCNKPNRTSGQLILKPNRKRKMTLAQFLFRSMFKSMVTRRKSTAANLMNEANVYAGRRRKVRKPLKFKPRRVPFKFQNNKRKLIHDF